MSTEVVTATENQNKQAIGAFGSGRYSPLMVQCFTESQQVFGLNEEQADKLARAIARDFGAAMKDAQVDAKIGKSINKDGQVTLAEASKLKGITITQSLFAMRALQWAADCGKYGFSWKFTDWKLLDGNFKDYIESL